MSDHEKRDWKSVKRKRNKQLNLRLSPEEYNRIKRDADALEITAGAYVRKVILNAPVPRKSKRPCVEVRTLARLLGQIGRIGGNINQLTKAANTGIPFQRHELEQELKSLRIINEEIKKALKIGR